MIDFDRFLEWAESRFDDIKVKGDEIKLNSIFCEDFKHHMWCNPKGGKKERPNGVFHCWKTGTKGSLITLVMLTDNCDYATAVEVLGGSDTNLRALEERVAEIMAQPKVVEAPDIDDLSLKLPPFTYGFDDLPSVSYHRVHAEAYLLQRRLPTAGLMVCTAGDYKNRIVIPYYNRQGELIYYNCRYIGENEKALRYMGPPKDLGVGKGDVLFIPRWPEPGTMLYLTEGEFDALSLCACGFTGAAFGGKALTEPQLEILRDMNIIPVICLDNDEAGRKAIAHTAGDNETFAAGMGVQLLSGGFKRAHYVQPPQEYKDWNAFLQKVGPRVVKHYVQKQTKVYDEWTTTRLLTKDL